MKSLHDIILPILNDIQAGKKITEVSELWGASKALFLCHLQLEFGGGPVIVVTATEEEAATLVEDLKFFREWKTVHVSERTQRRTDAEISLFPSWSVLPFEANSPDSGTVGERMRLLYNLISHIPGIYVVPAYALIQKLPPWESFVDAVKTITTTTQIDMDSLIQALMSTGYEVASLVTRVGEFSRRGGIVDFFSPLHNNPVRLEFTGDVLESIREFEPETQRSLLEISRAVVLPVRELIINQKGIERFISRIDNEALIDGVREGTLPPGAEFLSPLFYDMGTLFDYLPQGSLFACIEPDDIKKRIEEQTHKIQEGRREEVAEGRLLPDVQEMYLDLPDIEREIGKFPAMNILLLDRGAGQRMDTKSAAWLGMRLTKPQTKEPFAPGTLEGTMAGLVEKLKQLCKANRVFIVCGTVEAAARIKKLFMEYELGIVLVSPVANQDAGPWPIMITSGRLSEGFSWQELGITFITEEEIFGKKVHRTAIKKPRMAPFLSTFKELKPGDFIVHADYGVGEYQGLSHINVDGIETDFLALRYDPDAKLYVPLYSLDKVQKYVGVEGMPPKLNCLGSPAWMKTKEKIKKDILEMAQQLVAIYAAREAIQRTSFSPPDNLYREFESAFPYEETQDQEKAIEDVLTDMQRPRPMDRVVCGDVGYGKTEVALRAAFKAMEDGYQAAVLVPTTLLADQHFRTFSERLSPFAIRVDMLSRFRTKSEQKETLKGLKNGIVDMVIGTHRLLQRDVSFKNLGLLVVDEEHKFGVRHKERIKELKKLVDVLTLTATPIPRTLHMSLAGLRDLSIIQTPPLDRQAIQVALARFGKRVIREALIHELQRKGQVFFVHNRVQGIERIAAFVQSLVPEAKVGVVHGQMNEREIEDVMSRFIRCELNVLVTTTIIESGIDIPTANTIIINRADRFGLADLYQIKGRVGRSREKAYAYLLTPEDELLSDTARKRLRAIQELSELGSGFRIAVQDLETRGAGNLLGKQQSGHIAAIGIDLYTQMMEEAVAELQGEKAEAESDTLMNIRASAFIPEDYIGDVSLRLATYKELSSVTIETELASISEGLRDRYGELPAPVANLIEIMSIKCVAKRASVARIDMDKDILKITFAETARISPENVIALLKKGRGRIKLIPEYTLQIALPDPSLQTASVIVKKCLQELI